MDINFPAGNNVNILNAIADCEYILIACAQIFINRNGAGLAKLQPAVFGKFDVGLYTHGDYYKICRDGPVVRNNA